MDDAPVRSPRLRSLELQGYKTFASRTLFEFAPRITAIVGPNGSGKSNIADSLRWVLGEQTYSLLRGKKTEDMIFNGSETRPRASMASATIIFDNSDAWLPIEFADVVIGRRAYRDGENEYTLNNQKVRLRDVSELLSECGLGQRAHTIIGQGLVDAILALKPEERRRLIEEAAGIGLYRERREESLRRLEATRRNIERAKDILAELRPRLAQLERQARRARDYRQVRDDLLQALRIWYGHHWYRQQDAVLQARDAAVRQEYLGEELRQRQEAAERELSAIREQVNAERRRWQALSGETTSLRSERETLARRSAVAEERMRWLHEQEDLLQAELTSHEADLAGLQGRITELQAELDERVQELDTVSATVAAIESEPDRKEVLQRKVQELVGRLEAHAAKRAERAVLRSHLDERVRSLEAKREGLGRESEERVRAVEHARRQLAVAQQAGDQAVDQIRSLESRLDELRRRLTDQDGKHAALAGEQTKARAELTRIGAALEGLRMSAATGGQPLARLVEEQGEGGQLPGWVGRLAARMRVKPEHRAAVEAALGAFAEGLVFRSEEDLLRALAWLEAQEGWGEVGIVSQGLSSVTAAITVPADPSFIGLGSDLVETSPENRLLADRMLSRTLIVRDREGAARLVRWLPAGAQAVTLAGEVYLPGGAVVVRRERGAGPDPSFEARLEAARANQWKKVEQYDREVSTGLRELEEVRHEVEETEGALSNARTEEVEARLSRERLALSLQAAEEHRARVLHEISALEEESADLAAQRVDLEAVEEKSGEAQRLWEAELSAARALLEGETPGIEGEAPALLRLRRQVDEGRQRLEEMRGQEARLTESGRQRRERLGATRGTLLETDQERELHQASLAQLEGRLGTLEADLRASGERLDELEGTRSTLESDAARARTELQAAERLGSHAQIELAKREQELASLSRRIQDDFGLVAFDFDESQTVQVPLPIEGLVERLQRVEELPLEVESQVERLRAQLRRTGPISPEVQIEYEETRKRFEFLTQQLSDLETAETQIQEVVTELDDLMEREFSRTFEAVSAGFKQAFARLFGGGSARLSLIPSEDGTSSGIEIEARLPGRREQGLSMLSGGERSLTACALIFAMLNASPTPFCVLDEVDAMLDDANVVRFCEMLRELSRETQVVVITHNRQTIQSADVIYGVSMGSDSASQIVSLKLDEAERQLSR